MILSNISILNEIINVQREAAFAESSASKSNNSTKSAPSRTPTTAAKKPITSHAIFHDIKDPTIERWLNSSPELGGNTIYTYEFREPNDTDGTDGAMMTNDSIARQEYGETKAADNVVANIENDKAMESTSYHSSVSAKISAINTKGQDYLFKQIPVEKIKTQYEEDIKKPSLLTDMIANQKSKGNDIRDGISLLIYLPNKTDSVGINIQPKGKVSDVIKLVLKEHRERGMVPHLDYDNPQKYELRMHEGDGEPDLDFEQFELDREVKSIYQTSQSNEFCLCETDGGDNTSDDSDIVAMRGGTKPSPARTAPPMYNGSRVDSASVSDETSTRPDNPTDGSPTLTRNAKTSENAILVSIPNAGVVGVNINERTTLRDILPLISTRHKLRLYTDEYSFIMSTEDQLKLNLSSPVADMDAPIKSIGATEFELQRKVYADAARLTRPKSENVKMTIDNGKLDDKIVYNDLTASVYQEWVVVKKNKFGRRQDRYLGIDGEKVYNSKRGHYISGGGNAAGVYHAERDISQIRKVDLVREDNEHRTLRITWIDNREQYDLEYTCETSRDCNEILAKLKYLMKRLPNQER